MSSDKDFNLDFGDIAGGVTKKDKVTPPPEEKKEAAPAQVEEKTGITITLPAVKGKTYVFKDLSECTPDEFLIWAKGVYFGDLPSAKKLESLDNRVRAFKQIEYYHKQTLAYGNRGLFLDKNNKTLH